MLTLGIDPGTAITGYGLVRSEGDSQSLVDCGVVTTPSGLALPQRLLILYDGLSALVANWRPDQAAVEQLFFSRNVRTALAVGHARGVVLLALAKAQVPVAEYTPGEVKQAIVGYGRGRKEQIQEMVRIILGLEAVPTPDDAADALALALCHAYSERTRRLLAAAAGNSADRIGKRGDDSRSSGRPRG
ncbi:MAG: crossover junction endodeoxyribonuclease RuvC [Dehalococcoidales bacterium]|nr:crossover junction endodeoxyribonuclease RuvC [Dehalococcoidales bacterium]